MSDIHIRAGIDINSKQVSIGLIREDGSILAARVIPSCGAQDTVTFTDSVCGALEALAEEQGIGTGQIARVGVGIPGTADTRRGLVQYSRGLFGDNHPDLGALFARRLGRTVTVVQNSRAVAWAEHLFGAGRQAGDMICLTLDAGIGCGVVADGHIFGGPMNAAGEIGHTPIIWMGRSCTCGRRGCLEAYSGGAAIRRQAMERFPEKLADRPCGAESVFSLADEGDPDACALIRECTDKLAYGIAIAIDLFSIGTIVIAGCLSAHRRLLIDPLRDKILRCGYPAWASGGQIDVIPARLGADAPMIGAAFLTREDIRF